MKTIKAQWKVHTPGLLKEILTNNQTQVLQIPLQIFASLLAEVATRASEIGDAEMNALMCRLALYEISDPYSKEYDAKLTKSIIEKGRRK